MTLPAETVARGAVMVPRVWLIDTTGGLPQYPQTVTTAQGDTAAVWDYWTAITFAGGLPGREYRHSQYPNRVSVLCRAVAGLTYLARTGAIVVCWLPAYSRTQVNDWFAAIEGAITQLAASWPCAPDAASGAWLCTALEADASALALLVQTNWPVGWRAYLAGEHPADPLLGTPAVGPTGPRLIGAALA